MAALALLATPATSPPASPGQQQPPASTMASLPQAPAHPPADDLHTESLSFPLDALDTLSSTQLALVQFHPRADDPQIARARALFVHRRMAWLEQEMARARAREQAVTTAATAVAVKREVERSRSPLTRVKEEQDEGLVELQPEAGSSTSAPTSSPTVEDESPSAAVKREGGQQQEREARHRQLDAPRPPPRVLSPSATPTPAPIQTAASAPSRAVDRPARAASTTTSATVDPRRRPRPPAPPPVLDTAVIVKREVEEISLLDDDEDEADERPFALPRAGTRASSDPQIVSPGASGLSPPTKRSSDVAVPGGAGPSKAPRRAMSAASPPLPATAERLKGLPSFRRKGQASPPTIELSTRGGLVPTPTPTPPPAPAGLSSSSKPNPLARTATSSAAAPLFPVSAPSFTRTPIPRGIQAALRDGRAPIQSDWEFEHWLEPPSPFPNFVALGAPPVDKGANDPIAPALARRLYTVRVHGPSDECTAACVFWFILRNQGRLRPRPLAIRSTDKPPLYIDGHRQPREPVFFFAFGSLEAAKLIVKDNDQRLLPDMEDPRQISVELVRDEVSADATWDARRASEAKELEVGWRWGELSDEARWYWQKRADLPPSPVCPRFEDVEIEGRPLSDEYTAEVSRIVAIATGEPEPPSRSELDTVKKELYGFRRTRWRAWLALGPTQQAAVRARDETTPGWPIWPSDDEAWFYMNMRAARQAKEEAVADAVVEAAKAAVDGGGVPASSSRTSRR